MFGQNAYTHGLYPRNHLYSPTAQIEATNLSLSNAGRDRNPDKQKENEAGKSDTKRESDKNCDRNESAPKLSCDVNSDRNKQTDGSERTRGRLTKTDDRDKIKSSSKAIKSPSRDVETKKSTSDICVPENLSKNKSADKKRNVKSPDIVVLDSPNSNKSQSRENVQAVCTNSPRVSSNSPSRQKRSTNIEHGNSSATILSSPGRRSRAVSPSSKKQDVTTDIQEVPENLCIKDKCKDSDKTSKENISKKPLSVVPTSAITVTSTLAVISSTAKSSQDSTGIVLHVVFSN